MHYEYKEREEKKNKTQQTNKVRTYIIWFTLTDAPMLIHTQTYTHIDKECWSNSTLYHLAPPILILCQYSTQIKCVYIRLLFLFCIFMCVYSVGFSCFAILVLQCRLFTEFTVINFKSDINSGRCYDINADTDADADADAYILDIIRVFFWLSAL